MSHARAWGAVVLAVLLVVASCGDDDETNVRGAGRDQQKVSDHLDQLEALPVLQQVPPFAKVEATGRRDECHEPDFERREPAVWRDYTYTGDPEQVLDFYRDIFQRDGWQEADHVDNSSALRSVRFEKDLWGWTAAMRVSVDLDPSSYDVTAQDASSRVCPEG